MAKFPRYRSASEAEFWRWRHYRLEHDPGGFPPGGLFSHLDIVYGIQQGVWGDGAVFRDLRRNEQWVVRDGQLSPLTNPRSTRHRQPVRGSEAQDGAAVSC